MNQELTHEDIQEQLFVDRYVMGQLREEEQRQFEAHFALCATCMDQIEIAEAFQRDYRKALQTGAIQTPPRPSSLKRNSAWMGLAAAVLIALLAPQLFRAKPSVAWNLSSEVTRGAGVRTYTRPADDLRVILQIQVTAPYYRAELLDASGRSLALSQGKGAQLVELPPTELEEGRYHVDLEISSDGKNWHFEGEYPFLVETARTP